MVNQKLILLIIAFALFLAACGVAPAPVPSDLNVPVSENWNIITFKDMYGSPVSGYNSDVIGNAILVWEQAHPDRKIVSLQIIYQPDTYSRAEKVNGLSIYSQKVP
jgi:hypothetical protein